MSDSWIYPSIRRVRFSRISPAERIFKDTSVDVSGGTKVPIKIRSGQRMRFASGVYFAELQTCPCCSWRRGEGQFSVFSSKSTLFSFKKYTFLCKWEKVYILANMCVHICQYVIEYI